MAVYVYDTTQIDLFVTEDRGLVTASATLVDHGSITAPPDDDRDENNFNPHYYGEIRYTGDVAPFGVIARMNGGGTRTAYVPHINNTVLFGIQDTAEEAFVPVWVGSGSLFEIGGGLERLVVPDLGAAGPSPTIYGGSDVPVRTYSEVGSGTLAQLSDDAATFKYNRYPFAASGTLTVTGYNSQQFPDDYIPVVKNVIKVKGTGPENTVTHYRLDGNEVFDLDDYGFITNIEGADFSSADLSFDKTITRDKDRSFSDADQIEFFDYGVITETTRQVPVTRTIFPDELAALYNGQFFRTFLADGGTGTGNYGGFNVGRHVKFGNATNYRYLEFTLDTSNSPDISFDIIRGNFSNGGERPDPNEDLYLQYWNGSGWTTIPGNSPSVGDSRLVDWNDTTFDTLKTTTVNLPAAAQNVNQRIRVYQNYSTGPQWDQYGITQIVHRVVETQPIESQDDGELLRKLGGGLFAHAYQATGTAAVDREIYVDQLPETGRLLFAFSTTEPELLTYAHEATGGINITGENFFSQAPQSRVFGLEGEFEFSGSAEESFVPAEVEGTGLFDITGSAVDRIEIQTGDRKGTFRPTGFAAASLSVIAEENTATFRFTGATADPGLAFGNETTALFNITGEAVGPTATVFVPHFRSSKGDVILPPEDWGFIAQAPDPAPYGYEDWGYVRETATSSYVFGDVKSAFNYIQIGGQHYPSLDTFSVSTSKLIIDTTEVAGIVTLTLSDRGVPEKTFQYVTSGITGIATYKAGINIFGYNWFSQAPQHTVFGLEGGITISGSKDEAFAPFIEPQGVVGNFSVISGSAEVESFTADDVAVGDVYVGGIADVAFTPTPKGSGTITLRQGREEGQTYIRIIDTPEDEFGGLFRIVGGATGEKQTDSYNQSSIRYGQEDVDYGNILGSPVYGLDLSAQGLATNAETFDDETNTYDQDVLFSNSGLTWDQSSGGENVVPSFDKTDSFESDFSNTYNSEDYGTLEGIPLVGGPDYDQYLYPNFTGFLDQDGINKGYEDAGWITEPSQQPSRYPLSTGVALSWGGGAVRTQWIPEFPGQGSILVEIAGSAAVEKVAFDTPDSTQLFSVGGSATEAFVAQTPEDTQLFTISGSLKESFTADQVGVGTATFSGIGVEKATFDEVFSGITTISGAAIERSSMDPPEGTYLHIVGGAYTDLSATFATVTTKATMRLIGELRHPNIDYTPHYGIERNIGIETGFTLLPGSPTGEYGNPGIVTTRFIPDYPGDSGPIVLKGKAIGRTNAPILTDGTIYILGIGTGANGVIDPDTGRGDLDGVEFGCKERFIPATARGGPGLFSFKGIAETAPIRVYGYYGDDADPGASGIIRIRTEKDETLERTIIEEIAVGTISVSGGHVEKATFSEIGSGRIFKFASLVERNTFSEVGGGSITASGSATEAFVAQTPEDTQLFTISGEAKKSLLLTTDFGGTITLRTSFNPVSGISLTSPAGGTFSIIGGAAESITIPSITSTSLFNVSGVAISREIAVYGYYGDDKDPGTSGTITISGELTHPDIDFTPAFGGTGLYEFSGDAIQKFNPAVVGRGTATLSGTATEKFVSGAGEDTILFQTGGSAETALNSVYGYYGDDRDPGTSGTLTFSGASEDREIAVYGYYGDDRDPGTSGQITISGRPLVHPEVDFTPAITGTGLFKIRGIAQPARAFPPVVGVGTLFKLSSGDEAFARATYVGIGQFGFFAAAQTEILRFEEGRTYVVII